MNKPDGLKNHTVPEYVKYEPSNEMVFTELIDGKVDLSVVLSTELNHCDGLFETMDVWVNGTDEDVAIISPHFTVGSPLDYLIEMHSMPMQEGAIDIDAKPIFLALRSEMLAQIARIDAMVFSQGSTTTEA